MSRPPFLFREPSQPDIAKIVLGLGTLVIGFAIVIVAPSPIAQPLTLLVWVGTFAITTNLGITFQNTVASYGNILLTAAFLTLGLPAAMVVAIAGVILGELFLYFFQRQFSYQYSSTENLLVKVCANLGLHGLSILVGGWFYLALGGSMPLVAPDSHWSIGLLGPNLLPLIGLYAGYFLANYVLYALVMKLEGRSVRAFIQNYWRVIILLELVPTLLSFLVAFAALNMPLGAFALFCIVLAAALFVPHNLSLARARLAQRVRELDSLNAVGQAVASSLELPEVLEAIHSQVARLMDASYFYIALYDEVTQIISFPLVYENDAPAQYDSRPFGNGLTEQVIRSGAPLLIENDVPGFIRRQGAVPRDPLVKSWLGVPIVIHEQPLGIMAVQSLSQPNAYNASHRDILLAIATQTATAIRNSQMHMAARHQTTQLTILNSILAAINSTLDLNQLLTIIVTSVGQVMGNQKAAIYLLEDSGQTVTLAAAHNLSQDYIAHSRSIPLSGHERTVVIATQEPMIVDDIQGDPRLASFQSSAVAEGIRAFADVPLRVQNQVIGSLTIYYSAAHQFTAAELAELTTFANQAAIAVSNARLYTRADRALARRAEHLAALQEIGRDLSSSLDLNLVMRRLLERAIEATGATMGTVGIWNPEQGTLRTTVAHGYSPAETQKISESEWPITMGIIGRAVRTRQPCIVTDVQTDPDYVRICAATRSEMVVLIQRDNSLLGIINLESPQPGRFDQAALNFASQLATQAAIALHNAQLYQQAQSRLNELSILYNIGQQLTSILDLKELGNQLTQQLARALNVPFCLLNLVTPQTELMSPIAAYAADAPAAVDLSTATFQLADYPAARSAFERHELSICYSSDPQLDPGRRELLQRSSWSVCLAAPLYAGHNLIGAMVWADVRAERRFDENEIRLAATLASQAAIAVQNARLFEDRTRQLNRISQLYQASLALTSSVELAEVLRRITSAAREITEADGTSLYLYDDARHVFTHAYALGVSGEWGLTSLRPGGMTERVARERQIVRVDDTHLNPDVNPHTVAAGINSIVVVPLVSQDRSVGVLYVGSYRRYQFDDDDVQVVSALANQAATAVINAHLFADTIQSRDQLQATLNSARDGILLFDLTGRIIMVNPQLETMWALPQDYLVGQTLDDLLAQSNLHIPQKMGISQEVLQSLLAAIQAGQEPVWPKNTYGLSDSIPRLQVERECLPVLDIARRPIGWMLVLHDVTEELESQQMRDDLTDTIVHDLRSPLSSILGSLYILEEIIARSDDSSVSQAAQQALAISIRGSRKLLNLVNSLLDISKMRSGHTMMELRTTRLEPVLDDALEQLQLLAQESQVNIVSQLQPDLWLVSIDVDKITRVFINLIDNALKFTPAGGQITLIAENWQLENDQYFVHCAVRDTGPGIPLEFRARIFDRFMQIADHPGRRRGSGLGLNFCQLAVEAHGGKIWVDDAPGSGSEFSFTLPVATDTSSAQETGIS